MRLFRPILFDLLPKQRLLNQQQNKDIGVDFEKTYSLSRNELI
jgi:hypothetical protein